jgi:hypothetical protein
MWRNRKRASVNKRNSSPRLRREGHPTDQAEGMLVEMRNLLDDMRDHLDRLQQKPEG